MKAAKRKKLQVFGNYLCKNDDILKEAIRGSEDFELEYESIICTNNVSDGFVSGMY